MARLEIPVIGIGAGPATDGQVLVFHDLLGIYDGHAPRFAKRYGELREQMIAGRRDLRRRGARGRVPRSPSTPTRSTTTSCGRSRPAWTPWPRGAGDGTPWSAPNRSGAVRRWWHANTIPECRVSETRSLRATGLTSSCSRRPGRTWRWRPTCSTGSSSTSRTAGSWPREILECEHEGDRITHDIIDRLNHTFVTPIDREDILALASGLDDIVDYTEEVADYLGLYRIEAPMDQAISLAHVLRAACHEIGKAIPLLRGFKDISQHTVEVNRLENEGDRITREAVASLFDARSRPDGGDPVEGPVRAPRGGDRLHRARGAHPRGDRRLRTHRPVCLTIGRRGALL